MQYQSGVFYHVYYKARANDALQRYDKSIECYKKTIEIQPSNFEPYYLLAIAHYNRSEWEPSFKNFEKAYELNNSYGNALVGMGNIYKMWGNYDKCLECYDKAIILNPNEAFSYSVRGNVLNQLGRQKEALRDYNKLYELYANHESNYSNYEKKHSDYIQNTLDVQRKNLLKSLNNLQEMEDNFDKHVEQIKDPVKKENIFRRLLTMKKEKDKVSKEIFNTFSTKASDDSIQTMENNLRRIESQYSEMENEFKKMKSQVIEHEEILKVTGAYDKAYVVNSFKQLSEEDLRLFEYAKAFYWTLLNYFSAYRNISTNLQQNNLDAVTNTKEDLFVAGMKKAGDYVSEIASNIPLIGSIISIFDNIIDSVYGAIREKRFNDRSGAINKIIMFNQDPNCILEEGLSLTVSKAAVEITKKKKQEIFNPNLEAEKKDAFSWFNEKIEQVKEKMLSKGVDLYESQASRVALKDVLLLLSYMYKNHEIIINKTESLADQIITIVVVGKAKDLLVAQEKPKEEDKDKTKCSCFIL